MNSIRFCFFVAMLFVLNCGIALGQQSAALSTAQKKAIIERSIELLRDNYVFPERVKPIEEFVGQKLSRGGYDSLKNPDEFLESLNEDLQRQGKDRHLKISFGPARVKQIILEKKNEDEGRASVITEDWLRTLRFQNFRLKNLENLDGNIGYFRFLNFAPLAPARQSFIGSMNFLQYSSAIIIDLRDNGGGYSETMDFLLGFFLKDGLQISESRLRKGNRLVKSFVSSDPAVKKVPDDVPVFILVSNRTSSAAEAFAYVLQQYRRATVIGKQTQGEGNAGELFVVNDSLYMMIPTMENINPVSRKSIDGIGVVPDIEIAADKAIDAAKLEICRRLAPRSDSKELRQIYQWQIPYLENRLNPEALTETVVRSVVGEYDGGRTVSFENGVVLYRNSEGVTEELEYIGKGVFQNKAKPWLRLLMPFTDKPIPQFDWVWDDGGDPQTVKRVR